MDKREQMTFTGGNPQEEPPRRVAKKSKKRFLWLALVTLLALIAVVLSVLYDRGEFDGLRRRLTDSIETACSHSGGLVTIELPATGEELSFSQNYACEDCGISLTELEPRMFSFNNPAGACPSCTGLGFQLIADADLVIPDKNKSIFDGAIQASGWQSARTDSIFRMYFEALAQKYHFSLTEPVKNLPEDVMDVILYGTKGEKLRMSYNRGNGMGVLEQPFEGILNNISRRFRETQSDAARKELEECMATAPCPQCHGDRLSEIARAVTVGGIGIMDFCRMSVRDELEFMKNLRLEGNMAMVAEQIVKEIKSRQPATRVVMVMSSADSSGQLMRAIRLEANGYLLRTITPSDFVEQLRKTAQGGMAVSEKVTSALAEKLRGDSYAVEEVRRVSELTSREQDVLGYVAAGISNLEISKCLGISEGTVKVHVKHTLKKLKFRSRVELAVWASEHGFKVKTAGRF